MLARFLPRPSGARRFGWVDDEVGRPNKLRSHWCATEATSAVVTHGRAGEGRYTFVGLFPSLVSRSKQEELMRTKVLGCSVCKQEAGGLAVEAVFIG